MQKKRRETTRSEADVLVVHKNSGETMGQLLARVRTELNIPKEEKITFAGRLDPLACGLVLLLKGEKRFQKDTFLQLPKSYTFNLIFDVATDTLDDLGMPTHFASSLDYAPLRDTENALRQILPSFLGPQQQSYPLYSSKTVKGVPLFHYARKSISVEMPTRNIEIYSLELKGMKEIQRNNFIDSAEVKINSVLGDFRQELICSEWNKSRNKLPETLQVAHLVVRCSSGTYVRVLAEKIASKIGRLGIADNINRIGIGEFTNEQIIV